MFPSLIPIIMVVMAISGSAIGLRGKMHGALFVVAKISGLNHNNAGGMSPWQQRLGIFQKIVP
jgi:hypothetical protein